VPLFFAPRTIKLAKIGITRRSLSWENRHFISRRGCRRTGILHVLDAVDRNARLAHVPFYAGGDHCHSRGGWPDSNAPRHLAALPESAAAVKGVRFLKPDGEPAYLDGWSRGRTGVHGPFGRHGKGALRRGCRRGDPALRLSFGRIKRFDGRMAFQRVSTFSHPGLRPRNFRLKPDCGQFFFVRCHWLVSLFCRLLASLCWLLWRLQFSVSGRKGHRHRQSARTDSSAWFLAKSRCLRPLVKRLPVAQTIAGSSAVFARYHWAVQGGHIRTGTFAVSGV